MGYNLCRPLLTLGSQVDFLSLIGSDAAAGLVQTALTTDGIPAEHGSGAGGSGLPSR